MRYGLSAAAALHVLQIAAALAQGSIPVAATNALSRANSDKVAIHAGAMYIVYVTAAGVQLRRSAGGAAWEPPVAVSGSISKPTRPSIAIASNGTIGVTFLSQDRLYYTYRPATGAWSKPTVIDEHLTAYAMTIDGMRVHIAIAAVFRVSYVTFSVDGPSTAVSDVIEGRAICCASLGATSPAIAVAKRPDGERYAYIAYFVHIDATTNTCPCPERGYILGVRVAVRPLSKRTSWIAFEDVRSIPKRQRLLIAGPTSLSSTTDGTDVFIAYSDRFGIVNGFDIEPVSAEQPSRTKIVRYSAEHDTWMPFLFEAGRLVGAERVDVLSITGTNANLRLTRQEHGPCGVVDMKWAGNARAPSVVSSIPISSCFSGDQQHADAQAVQFTHPCPPACEVRAVYIDDSTPPLIRTAPACAPASTPDIRVTHVASSNSWYAGGEFPIAYTTRNDGLLPSLPSTTVAFLSWNRGRFPVATFRIPGLPPGASRTQRHVLTVPPTIRRGVYSLVLETDADQRNCEADEHNNAGVRKDIAIADRPTCSFERCAIRGETMAAPYQPSRTRYVLHGSPYGCAWSTNTTFAWYRRRTGAGAAWGAPIQTGSQNSVTIPGVAAGEQYDVLVYARSGAATCTARYTWGRTESPVVH